MGMHWREILKRIVLNAKMSPITPMTNHSDFGRVIEESRSSAEDRNDDDEDEGCPFSRHEDDGTDCDRTTSDDEDEEEIVDAVLPS